MKLLELLDYCVRYKDSIFVRAKLNDKWGSYKLSELPDQELLFFISHWNANEITPARLLEGGIKQ